MKQKEGRKEERKEDINNCLPGGRRPPAPTHTQTQTPIQQIQNILNNKNNLNIENI